MPIIGVIDSSKTGRLGLSVDVLVVAGGASGGAGNGGGGGAGGLLAFTSQSVAFNTSTTVTVGAGGASKTWTGAGPTGRGNNGTNSSFGALTAAVGGGGGGNFDNSLGGNLGAVGGSGGGNGGQDDLGQISTPAAGTSGQGNAGGQASQNSTYNGGGGGGGAGAVGSNASVQAGGNGGAGSSAYSAWGSATSTGQNVSGTFWYAGGGGGGNNTNTNANAGTGGNGGGGAGGKAPGSPVNGTAGTANTGGGGGGSGNAATSGAGGSGVVVVRYLGTQRAFGGKVTSSGGYTYHAFTSSSSFDTTTQLPAGMMLWLDASDTATITQSSNLISQWLDKSGNNYTFTASGSARPTLTANGLNGRSVVTFDGSANAMLGTNTSGANTTSWSLFIVARGNTSATQTVLAKRGAAGGAGDDNFGAGYFSGKSYARGRNLSGGTNATLVNASVGLWIMQSSGSNGLTGSAQLSSTIMTNNSSIITYFNQANPASATAGSQAITGAGEISIGNLQAGGTAEILNGYIAEIILYPSALGDTDRQTVEQYLKSKWAI